ncbi:MAG: hypothetical protein LKF36_07985 [Lactobacillus sp.]|jgi:hypothetical protein|nr:hypothetical protein [Lactobacillus sp.]
MFARIEKFFENHNHIITIILAMVTICLTVWTAVLQLTTDSNDNNYQRLNTRINRLERDPHFVLTINELQSSNDKLISLSNESTSKLKDLEITTQTFAFIPIRFDIGTRSQIFPVLMAVPQIDNEMNLNSQTVGELISFKMNQLPGDHSQQATNFKNTIASKQSNESYKKAIKEANFHQDNFTTVEPYLGLLIKANISYQTITSSKVHHVTMFRSSRNIVKINDSKQASKLLDNEYQIASIDVFDTFIVDNFENPQENDFFKYNLDRFQNTMKYFNYAEAQEAFDTFHLGADSHRGVQAYIEK